MLYSISQVSTVLLLVSSALALPVNVVRVEEMPGMAMSAAGSKEMPGMAMAAAEASTPAATTPSSSTTSTGGASAAQLCDEGNILAQSIAVNIADQKMEAAALATVKTLLAANPVDMVAFTAAKSNLVSFVNKGIAIRQTNQLITPVNNMATEGLAIVANAQLDELRLSSALTGVPATDAPAISKLEMGFTGGTAQNMKNMAAATQGCSSAQAAGAAPATTPTTPESPAKPSASGKPAASGK